MLNFFLFSPQDLCVFCSILKHDKKRPIGEVAFSQPVSIQALCDYDLCITVGKDVCVCVYVCVRVCVYIVFIDSCRLLIAIEYSWYISYLY